MYLSVVGMQRFDHSKIGSFEKKCVLRDHVKVRYLLGECVTKDLKGCFKRFDMHYDSRIFSLK